MRVLSGQSLLDIAVQVDGSVETVFEWALANDKSITDRLTPGEILVAPGSALREKDIANYFYGIQKKLATGITAQNHELIVPDDGIGAMIIGSTFIVS
ncbi:hypothetical protein GCM10008015_26910 [Flavobacterium palustre]|uniref:LysM domain-containing protein n=1 Tax=Flavobacterium palustre TaxID=1476463 RepID=A0ABQ1HQL5_9FLAO|nr:LysM domain-containing protein [Flavobacterium palustre]GGA84745.1 hypothetical protein GCM10008015_26910 [Flavobacterium palustre]